MTLILTALLLLQDPVTPDQVIKLTQDGVAESEILKKIGTTTFALSADEIVALKQAGVSDRVMKRMIAGPKEIFVKNLAHKPVRITVRGGRIEVSLSHGEELGRGAGKHFHGAGELAVMVEGRLTNTKVLTPATLTFRGCDIDDFEVMTLYIEDTKGSDTVLVQSRDKTAAKAQESKPRVVYRRGLPPGSGPILRGGLLDHIVDGVTGLTGGLADCLFGY